MRKAAVTLINAVLIAAALLVFANYFDLPFVREAGEQSSNGTGRGMVMPHR